MSSKIKDDDDDIHSATIEEGETQVQEVTEEQPQSGDSDVNGEPSEDIIPAAPVEKQRLEIEPSVSLSDTDDTPGVPVPSDVGIEKEENEEDPLPPPASEDNDGPLSTSEEPTSPSIPVQPEASPPADDTHQLLKIVADKSNKEASSAILNTVCRQWSLLLYADILFASLQLVDGDFDLDKNYIIQKSQNLSDLFSIFNQLSSSLQAEILSVFIGIMRKSERNLLASVDAQIYEQVLKLLHGIDDDVVADLLVDILMVLTSLTINVNELKHLLRYLKTENRVWVSRYWIQLFSSSSISNVSRKNMQWSYWIYSKTFRSDTGPMNSSTFPAVTVLGSFCLQLKPGPIKTVLPSPPGFVSIQSPTEWLRKRNLICIGLALRKDMAMRLILSATVLLYPTRNWKRKPFSIVSSTNSSLER